MPQGQPFSLGYCVRLSLTLELTCERGLATLPLLLFFVGDFLTLFCTCFIQPLLCIFDVCTLQADVPPPSWGVRAHASLGIEYVESLSPILPLRGLCGFATLHTCRCRFNVFATPISCSLRCRKSNYILLLYLEEMLEQEMVCW